MAKRAIAKRGINTPATKKQWQRQFQRQRFEKGQNRLSIQNPIRLAFPSKTPHLATFAGYML